MQELPASGSAKLRLGVLGCAGIATGRVLPAARYAKRVDVVAIASRDIDRARSTASRFNIPRAHGSYEALLRDEGVDAIYNPLPNSLHAAWTVAAAEAGKHVLCEKPLSVTLREGRTMVTACEQHHVQLMEAFMYRHHPQHAVAREFLQRPDMGKLVHVRSSFSFVLGKPQGNIRLMPDLAGGALMDVGCYTINLARWMVGSEPQAVQAWQRDAVGAGVDTTVAMLLEFADGQAATLDASFDKYGGGRYELVCEYGMVSVGAAFTPGAAPVTVTCEQGERVETRRVTSIDQYALELDHFAAIVLDGIPRSPAENGLANMAVVDAVHRAMATGARVDVEVV